MIFWPYGHTKPLNANCQKNEITTCLIKTHVTFLVGDVEKNYI